MHKRTANVLLMCLLAVMIGSCGRADSSQPDAGSPAADRPVVGVSIPAATHGWPAGVGWWAQQTMARYPQIDWRFQRASRATDQVAHVEAMLQQGLDALVILPMDSDTPLSAVRRARQRGIYVVSVDRGLRQPVADVYVAGDNRAFGRVSAQFMVDRLGGQGRIVILRGMPVQIDTERYEAAMEVFAAHQGIEVLGVQPGHWNRQTAHEVMQTFLAQHDRIDAVWAADDDMALGVEQAIREAGRLDEMWVLGGAGMKQIVKRVMDRDPLYPANVTYPPAMIAAGLHVAAAQVLQAGNVQAAAQQIPAHLGITAEQLAALGSSDNQQAELILPVHLIEPGNAKEYYFPDAVY